MAARKKKLWHKPGRVRNEHPKGWSNKGRRRYSKADKWGNLLAMSQALDHLPIARLEDKTRQYRPDPRHLPEGTPLCLADHCWRMNSCGMREAFGIGDGAVARLVEANDAGVSNEGLRAMLLNEALR